MVDTVEDVKPNAANIEAVEDQELLHIAESKAEFQAQLLVGQVERVFARAGIPRHAGERENLCGLSAQLVERSAEGMNISAPILSVDGIHRKYSGTPRTVPSNNYVHAFNIAEIPGANGVERFLIDETVGQYITQDDQLSRWDSLEITNGTLEEHGIIVDLARNGYVPLKDDETLREYLRATTEETETSYLDQVRIDDVMADRNTHGARYSDDTYLDGLISGKSVIDLSTDTDDLEE